MGFQTLNLSYFSAFSDGWQQYMRGEDLDVSQWAKEHSEEILEAAGAESAEWDEEDEEILKNIDRDLQEFYSRRKAQAGSSLFESQMQNIRWIKSLKERHAWKKSLVTADLENSLCDMQDGYSDTSREYRILGEAIKFIRCTEPQPHWEPSDEQITWLYRAADDASKDSRMKQVLNELLEQLKKLKG